MMEYLVPLLVALAERAAPVALTGLIGVEAVKSILTLRAKHRAKDLLLDHVAHDEALKDVLEKLKSDKFTDAQLKVAKEIVAEALSKLSKSDIDRIKPGFNQLSLEAEKRFLEDIVSFEPSKR